MVLLFFLKDGFFCSPFYRNVATNDRNGSNGPLGTVELEDGLHVRQAASLNTIQGEAEHNTRNNLWSASHDSLHNMISRLWRISLKELSNWEFHRILPI
jgi:hypothetical protein